MKKPVLWLLLARLDDGAVPYVIPTLAWMARVRGVLLECYLESERDGRLFAETGSTVLGGHHHQQFNYLCARFDVRIVRLGASEVFASSIRVFGLETLAEADDAAGLYEAMAGAIPEARPAGIVFGPSRPLTVPSGEVRLAPYLAPEILYRQALGFPASSASSALEKLGNVGPIWTVFAEAEVSHPARVIDRWKARDDIGTVTARVAARWKKRARGVVFADPAAVLAQLATHCRHDRLALFAPADVRKPAETRVSNYTESISPAARRAATLAVELNNPVLHGRQTGDGDIFEWSRQGVCIQIVDPSRPAFPIVEEARHPWESSRRGAEEASDEQLESWAREGRVLTTLVVHSGEVAHNEAMLALVEMAGWAGLKFGAGVHAARYESCPQLWELLAVAREHGGAAGLVEPLLHSGGLGVMAECHCPPAKLADHCGRALERIRAIAGRNQVPRGYYAFMDSNLDLLDEVRGDLFAAIAGAGLRHIVSSACPGRNRVLWQNSDCVAVNQTPRVIYGASPFVRIGAAKDLETTTGAAGPGWIVATLDAPVVAFAPYIWREGNAVMEIVRELQGPGRVNVLPGTVARYARLLERQGFLPKPLSRGVRTARLS